MTLTYELVQRDFYEAFVAHRNRSASFKWFVRFMVFGLIVLAVTNGLLTALPPHGHFRAEDNFLPLLLLAAFWTFVLWGQPWLAARSQFGKQPSAQGPRTMLSDGSGIHWKWNGGSADLEWKNFVRFLEAKNHFLLYSSPACFNIVPKRALSPDQADAFRQLVAANLPLSNSAAQHRKVDPRTLIFFAVIVFALVALVMVIRNVH